MSNPTVATNDHVVVVRNGGGPSAPQEPGRAVNPNNNKFYQTHPTALGTVEIMIGIFLLMSGIMVAVTRGYDNPITKIIFWGPGIFIVAGSFTIAADKMRNDNMVKRSLGMNLASAFTAAINMIAHSFEIYFEVFLCNFGASREQGSLCVRTERIAGIAGVMLILCTLEFVVSIFISSFACKLVYCRTPEPVIEAAPSPQANNEPPSSNTEPSSVGAEGNTEAETDSTALPEKTPPPYSPDAQP